MWGGRQHKYVSMPQMRFGFYPKDEQPGNETEAGEDEPDDDIHLSMSHGLYAPWIEETETSLKLTLAVLHSNQWPKTFGNLWVSLVTNCFCRWLI
jgi:hypothetical protein